MLTFVVVGGGPTGVELAGAIAEMARDTLRQDFRAIDPAAARVVLVEGQPRVLPMSVEKLSGRRLQALTDLGVEVIRIVTSPRPARTACGSSPTPARPPRSAWRRKRWSGRRA